MCRGWDYRPVAPAAHTIRVGPPHVRGRTTATDCACDPAGTARPTRRRRTRFRPLDRWVVGCVGAPLSSVPGDTPPVPKPTSMGSLPCRTAFATSSVTISAASVTTFAATPSAVRNTVDAARATETLRLWLHRRSRNSALNSKPSAMNAVYPSPSLLDANSKRTLPRMASHVRRDCVRDPAGLACQCS